jgi:hypothetical protein
MPTVSPIPTAASRTAGATWRPTAGNGRTARALTDSADLGTVVHKPGRELDDPKELLLGSLDYYRSVIIRKVDGLTDAQLRESRLPSGWTPLELLKHLSYMARRWLRCGFRAEQLPDPHGDEDQAGRWHAGPGDTAASLIAALLAAGEQTRAIACAAELTDISAPGGRFSDNDPRPLPTLAWSLIYVLQEYARHAGHLDVAPELVGGTTELVDGTTGELPGVAGPTSTNRGWPCMNTMLPDHDHREKQEGPRSWRWVT